MNLGCRQPMDHILHQPAEMLNKTQKGKRGFTKQRSQDKWNRMFSLQQFSSERGLHTGHCGRDAEAKALCRPCFFSSRCQTSQGKEPILLYPSHQTARSLQPWLKPFSFTVWAEKTGY